MWVRLVKELCKNSKTYSGQLRTLSSELKLKREKPHCIISCKRHKFDHYSNTFYDKLDAVPLASKGWTSSKSKGDCFTVNPSPDEYEEEMVPFQTIGIHPDLIEALNRKGIRKATAFQARVIPTMVSNKHLMIAAETGCGKTLSYLLPIIQTLIEYRSKQMNSPKALILVPSRELAYQVGEIAEALSEPVGVRVKVVVGGQTKKIMTNPEFSEVDILVATPGALGKLSTVGIYKLNNVLYTVLDEADTLTDDSFVDRITGIVRRVSQSKFVLVSATLPKSLPDVLKPIEATLQEFVSPKLHKPLLNITQKFLRVTRSARPSHLLQIAKSNKSPMLVFTNRNERCNWLAMFLRENDVPCANINGDMNYAIRIEQWNNFIRGDVNILSATDVGSRGLDTTQVKHVLNYDFPIYAADYLHRVGRVGRLGGLGSCKVTNFVSGPEEIKLVQQIEFAIRKNQALLNVDGNITNIVQKKILRE